MRLLPLLLVLVLGACSDKKSAEPVKPVGPQMPTEPAKPAPAEPATPPPPDRDGAWVAKCFKFPVGITIVSDDAQLQSMTREDPPMNEGCPDEIPATGLNFDEVSLVVAYQQARCEGNIATTDLGFVWGEKGACEMMALLKATKVVPKSEAMAQQLVKLEM